MFDDDDYLRFNRGLVHMPRPKFNEVASQQQKMIVVDDPVEIVELPPANGGCIVDIPKTERKVFDVKCK